MHQPMVFGGSQMFQGFFHISTISQRLGWTARTFLLLKKEGKKQRTHRIHGAAIYGNMDPINIPPLC